ncbi:MAG: helix-turn-helix transcriptional regulator [Clostridia bacterium]|nr:helix-turn-helix transcriptional regulator [Clostridia bacterium]
MEMKELDLQNIQKRLRSAIKESGIQQKEIAKQIGVSAQTVSKYMKADIFPALDTLAKLCVVIDVSADYILGIDKK